MAGKIQEKRITIGEGEKKNKCNENSKKIQNNFISVNFHLTKACNYACTFCYARFRNSITHLPLGDAKKIVKGLTAQGTQKITFVGGEPLLYPRLGELIEYAHQLGLTIMIVTNGSLITEDFLEQYGKYINWIGYSIDSCDERVCKALGRHPNKKYSRIISHIELIKKVVPLTKSYGIKIKINTVVTALNWKEDMKSLLEELTPDRWKVFQVLKIRGENDRTVDQLLITREQFHEFIARHTMYSPVAETNDSMTGSYIIIDPQGRFVDNTTGELQYSRSILEIGVNDAFREINFSLKKLYDRGGYYNWKN